VAVTEEQLAAAAVWLDAHAAAQQAIKDAAQAQARAAWLGFDGWYDAVAVAAVASRLASVSQASQATVVGSARAYITNVVSILRGTRPALPTQASLPPTRNGAPLDLVHTRPAETYKKAIAVGKTESGALIRAVVRSERMLDMDLTLANREASKATLRSLSIDRYRRVIHPELSKGGTCGMCVVASDRIYYVEDLMPIHDLCKCEVMPIAADVDPGIRLNEVDVAQFYEDAGGTQAPELKRTRYAVEEHGEYGPVLVRQGDNFRDRSKVALEDDPERAGRLLTQALPVLASMEAGGATSDAQLAYQRDLVERLTSIVGGAAA
jgi:hypothetical protein